jgi:hypothetical protein
MSNQRQADEHRDLNHIDEFYKTLIKPIRDDFISGIIGEANKLETYSPWDKEFNWRERWDPKEKLKKLATQWASNWLINLTKRNFPYVYIMNGNSNSLDELFRRVDNIAFKQGDYSYYSQWFKKTGKQCQILEEPRSVDEMVVSWPGYSQGDRTELDFALQCNPTRLHLDCAYLGLVEPDQIDVTKFETISLSLSKSLSIPYNRVSILYSKKEIPELEILNRIGYVNLAGVNLANILLEKVPHDYWWSNYGNKIEKLCINHELTPTKSILFAYDKNGRRLGLAPHWHAETFYSEYLHIDTFNDIKKEIDQFYIDNPIPDSYFKIINCYKVMEALPSFKKWCIDNKLTPIKVAYISTPANTRQSPHKDDGEEILAVNFPVVNNDEVVTEQWDESGLASIKLMTKGTYIPYYRYLVSGVTPNASYILDKPVILNIKKVHSVVNNTDKPRVSLSFRFYNDPWHLINGQSNGSR